MSESARQQQLWLAAWVIGFAVAMSCLLLVFKHRAAIDHLQRERLQLVANGISDTIEKSLTFGISFGGMESLPEVIRSQKASDALIAEIDVADTAGTIVYSTDTSRNGRVVEEPVREAMARVTGETWHVREDDDVSEGAVVRNSFGLALGHVVVRYRLDGLNESSRAFVRQLALWGVIIGFVCTMLLYLMLRLLHSRLERKLARLRAIVLHPSARVPDDALSADAAAARVNFEEANQLLDKAGAAIGQPRPSAEGVH